jgi:hypothetical protein
LTKNINKKEMLAKYMAAKSKTISLNKILYEPFASQLPGLAEPWDYRPIVDGYLHKPFANQTKAEHMVAFYIIFVFIFKDKNFQKQAKDECLLDYKECLVFLGLKYNTMLTMVQLTEVLEMALLSSGRIPERTKIDGCDYLFINNTINNPVPRFSVLAQTERINSFWDTIALGKRKRKKFSELTKYDLEFDPRMSRISSTLREFQDYYKNYKGKAKLVSTFLS